MTRAESEGKKYIKLSQELAIGKVIEYMKLENTPEKIRHGKLIPNYEKRKTTTNYLLVIGNILVFWVACYI